MSLLCQVDSNPKAMIFWLKNDKEVIQIGERLNLIRDSEVSPSFEPTVRDNFNAEYTCQARSSVFNTISRRLSIITEGLPTIIGDPVYYAGSNKETDVDFTVLSNPPYEVGLSYIART